jgi:predicted acetyltransferase
MTTAMTETTFAIETPSLARLPDYAQALERGWSPNNVRDVSGEQLAAIRADAPGFIASLLEHGGTVKLPDGSEVPKLPSRTDWMWDGAFCGSIGLRWQPGTDALPHYTLGHIGFAVVPWKRGHGYAARALALMLPHARAAGLRHVEVTTEPGNVASRRSIEKNGGRLIGEFVNPIYGPEPRLRYVIDLANVPSSRA